MAITDYSSLKTAVADHLGRGDITSSSSVLDDWIGFTTDYLNYGGTSEDDQALRCREMESVEALTPSSGICTLPSDYLTYKRVVEKASIRRPLAFITEDAAEQFYPTRPSGLASHFTIIGSSLYTFPLASNDIELTFYEKIANLTSGATTNWLITKSPQVYFRGCLMFASDYIKDVNEFARQTGMLRALVAGLNGSNNLAKFGNAGMTIPVQAW